MLREGKVRRQNKDVKNYSNKEPIGPPPAPKPKDEKIELIAARNDDE